MMFGRRNQKDQALGSAHYTGVDRDGREHHGAVPFHAAQPGEGFAATAADFVGFVFRLGWQSLTLTEGDQVVGSIGPREDEPGRRGWALVPYWHENDLRVFSDPHGGLTA